MKKNLIIALSLSIFVTVHAQKTLSSSENNVFCAENVSDGMLKKVTFSLSERSRPVHGGYPADKTYTVVITSNSRTYNWQVSGAMTFARFTQQLKDTLNVSCGQIKYNNQDFNPSNETTLEALLSTNSSHQFLLVD